MTTYTLKVIVFVVVLGLDPSYEVPALQNVNA